MTNIAEFPTSIKTEKISDADIYLKKYLASFFKIDNDTLTSSTKTLNNKLDIFSNLDSDILIEPTMCFALGNYSITSESNPSGTVATIVKDDTENSHISFTGIVSTANSTGTDYNPESIIPLKYIKYNDSFINNTGFYHRKLAYINELKYYKFYTKELKISPFIQYNTDTSINETFLQLTGSFDRNSIIAQTDTKELLINTSQKLGEITLFVGQKCIMGNGMIVNGKPITYTEIIKTVPIYRIEFPYLLYSSFDTDIVNFTINLNISKSNYLN